MLHRAVTTFWLAAATPPPAGGAALNEVLGASVGVAAVTALLLLLGWRHRTRRSDVLTRIGDRLGTAIGRPAWVALPATVLSLSLLTALFGMLWDISLHIGQGRDAGPLANPAHYFILVGLFGVLTAGSLAIVMPLDGRPGPAAVKITCSWYAPTGGLLIAASGGYALIGFPLDDVWHRLFGQDVTLWGPTHLMLITGAGLSIVGGLVLEQEGRRHAAPTPAVTGRPAVRWLRQVFSLGGLLIGLSVFQAEFDFGVPQFRQVLEPMMIAGAAGLAMVAARLWLGRGAAVGCATYFLLVRGVVSLVVGPVLGEPTPSFPLYLGAALVIELLALLTLVRRPLAFGAVAGLAVGTVGTLTEAAWSHATSPLPWGSDVLVEALLMTAAVGTAAGACGALLALGLDGRLPRPRIARPVLLAAVAVLAVAVTNGLIATVPTGVSATVSLQDVAGSSPREVTATVQLEPPTAVDNPAWLTLTAWQGGGLVVERLERTGPGAYRSTRPLPVTGDWKTLLRLQDGRTLAASPVFLPADAAIAGAVEVPALRSSTRPVGPEIAILQRERNLDVPAWLYGLASLLVLGCTVLLVTGLSWGVARLTRANGLATAGPAGPPSGGRLRAPARLA